MTRKIQNITAIAVAMMFVLSAGPAQARGKVPGARHYKAQRGEARNMARHLRQAGVPMKMVLAPLRIVRSSQKMNRVKTTNPIKVRDNSVLPTKGTWSMTATTGQLAYSQKLSNTRGNRAASYAYTMPNGKGKMGVGESIAVKSDVVHHRSWKTNAKGTKVQTDRLAFPGRGGDALLQTTRTVTSKDGKIKTRTTYEGVSQVGKMGEIYYKLSREQFKQKRNTMPYVFPGGAQ